MKVDRAEGASDAHPLHLPSRRVARGVRVRNEAGGVATLRLPMELPDVLGRAPGRAEQGLFEASALLGTIAAVELRPAESRALVALFGPGTECIVLTIEGLSSPNA